MLTFIIAADLTVIGGASFVLMNRLQEANIASLPVREAAAAPPSPPADLPVNPPEIKRHILFRIKVPKAKRVQIIGDFTDELPRDLAKNDQQTWTITLPISPGVYTYNYVINGQRKIRDPNNARATPDHKSILTVKGASVSLPRERRTLLLALCLAGAGVKAETRLPSNVTVITREQIDASRAQNLSEIIEYQPGLQVIRTGTFGSFAVVKMR